MDLFIGRDSAEASAEASVKMAEASVSAESRFRSIRSFTTKKYPAIKSAVTTVVPCRLLMVH